MDYSDSASSHNQLDPLRLAPEDGGESFSVSAATAAAPPTSLPEGGTGLQPEEPGSTLPSPAEPSREDIRAFAARAIEEGLPLVPSPYRRDHPEKAKAGGPKWNEQARPYTGRLSDIEQELGEVFSERNMLIVVGSQHPDARTDLVAVECDGAADCDLADALGLHANTYTVRSSTPDRQHRYYRAVGFTPEKPAIRIEEGLPTLATARIYVAPCSYHVKSNTVYGVLHDLPLAPITKEQYEAVVEFSAKIKADRATERKAKKKQAEANGDLFHDDLIPVGNRHEHIRDYVWALAKSGESEEQVLAKAIIYNEERCEEPKDTHLIEELVRGTFANPDHEPDDVVVPAERVRKGMMVEDFLQQTPEETEWLLPGYAPVGWALKLAAREKGGKGTWVFYLLGRGSNGDPTVLGPTPAAFTACIVSEEPDESLIEKLLLFKLRGCRIIRGHELAGLTWEQRIAWIIAEAVDDGHKVIFCDNFSRLAGIEDENGVEAARAFEALADQAKKYDIAVWIDWHHKKGGDYTENKSRGGTALAGAMDVNIEMERKGVQSRRRKFTSIGRLRATNWQRTFELNEAGDDYHEVLFDFDGDDEQSAEQREADAELLSEYGTVDAKEFAVILGISSAAPAKKRLDALVSYGMAKTTGKRLVGGKWTPALYYDTPAPDQVRLAADDPPEQEKPKKKCGHCGIEFPPKTASQKYHNEACRKAASKTKKKA